ncbi:MAG TPA: efflux RND transporter permease subunit [Rhizomicrobium sp.]|jgi:HAE1 family hydrophobic/amphiphilic exporter-1|nr:efflux RND transporter permease subunit [Rhizomicrobium sp.]
MNVSSLFIRRPIMTILVMAGLVIFGAFGYFSLPVSELPAVDFPTIVVSASLPGADPETMASAVATPLENQFSTIAGISSMTSSSTQGSTQISIQFDLDRNIDGAAQDVQAAISAAGRRLPQNMPTPPTLRKVNPSDSPIMYLALGSPTLPLQEVDKYAETLLARQLSTLSGVAQVNVYGSQKFAVRIQADPVALAARGIGIDQVANIANAANPNIPTGSLNGETQAVIVHSNGQLEDAAQFNRQIIAYRNGAPVRVEDVAKTVNGVENKYVASWYNGRRAIVLAIQRQPGSNTISVVNEIRSILPRFMAQLPATLSLEVLYDRSQSIRESVSDVEITLLLAAALVVGVIFAFLRTAQATIIPSLALPIAVIGTFAGMAYLGYSLDNLSLMALTLSVGFVVDDAIVMLENIVRHVEQGEAPFEAALKGSREIAFTILSMTASLAAVFIPLIFMGGIIGRLLHEFAVTIVLAIAFSGLVSVTLTPMLCARMLRPERHRRHNRFYAWSERTFNAAQAHYERTLRWSLSHRRTVLAVFFGSVAATVGMFLVSKQDFLPTADQGQIFGLTEAANGTSFQQMVRYQQQAAAIVAKDPNIAGFMSAVGSGGSSSGVNSGRVFASLKPLSERTRTCSWVVLCHPTSAAEVADELDRKLKTIPGIDVFMQVPPSIRIGAHLTKSQYQYTLQDLDQKELQRWSIRLMNALSSAPGFKDVTTDLQLSAPAVNVTIDRDRAAALGVTPTAVETALGAAFGGEEISQIYGTTDTYQVILEVQDKYQAGPSDLSRLYVTSQTGTLVPLTAVTKISNSTMPLSVNHQGQLPAVTVSFGLQPGYTLSDAVSTIDRTQRRIGMPETVQTSFQGTAQAFQQSTRGTGLLLLAALVVVYIVLGILYESFIHPLTILSGLPSAAVGALITLFIFQTPLSLYAFVGMIMLIGIVKKNAIMMIDFALARERGERIPPETAIFEAAVIRFRPIMMTTMAALMGTLPIAIGFGSGGETRQPLGLAVVGGLLLSQLLTLYITPVLYIYLDRLSGRFFGRLETAHAPAE